MPKASVLQPSFSSGELSPLYYGQADNPRYKKGLVTGINFLPLLQGPIIRRPGTKYCATTKQQGAPILIPFKFSQSQAYILEFGNNYIRFYANNGQLVTSGASVSLVGQGPNILYTDPVRGILGSFYATRANANLQQGENVITSQAAVLSGSILELKSPYQLSDLPLIRWAQKHRHSLPGSSQLPYL